MLSNPLLDDDFLKELYRNRQKTIFAKVIALTLENDPIEEIQGQVTGGSVNIDGTSNVRRSCNISLVAKELNINQYYWGLKNRFKLYIGLTNNIGWGYEDIIWFPMGTYVISNFTTSQSVNSYNISITGKDKMCLLNGDLSGSLFASVDFGKEEYYNKLSKKTTISYIPIKNIIREAVHAYANENWENIIINDLDDYGVELLDYNGDKPMYLYCRSATVDNTKEITNYTVYGEQLVYPIAVDGSGELIYDEAGNYQIKEGYEYIDAEHPGGIRVDRIGDSEFVYEDRIELDLGDIERAEATRFVVDLENEPNEAYTIIKIVDGDTCGYRLTDITYPGDLILGVGEPLTALFDKLVAMLGNFEYFYDLDGRFVFQRKRTFIDKTWNNIRTGGNSWYVTTLDETYVESAAYTTPITWTFGDSFLITAYSNAPVLNNVKNDFSIWGRKASVSGTELPVHLRYAVDKKPTYYKTLEGKEWTTEVGQWWVKDGEGVVDVTYDDLVNLVKEEAKDKIRKRIKRNIQNFEPSYTPVNTLQLPIKNEDGSWTSGWWDLRDWHTYYKYLTGEDPIYHMRMYATNPENDPNKLKGYVEDVDFSDIFGGQISGTRTISKVWLFNAYKYEDGTYYVDTQHNGTFQSTYLDDDGVRRTYEPPFSGCSVHTYSYFEDWLSVMDKPEEERVHRGKKIVDAYAYFYFPDFPAMSSDESFEEYIEEEVEKQLTPEEIDALIAEKGYRFVERKAENLCDWREIIFQMALDYRKHNHDDDFYINLRNANGKDLNNQWYYPNGKTGYEQYYVDMEGFWRQLYCPPQLMATLYPSGVWTERLTSGGWEYSTGAFSPDNENGIYFSSSTGIVYYLNSYDGESQWINSWVEHQNVNDGWNVQVLDAPETLNFWFDFLEADEDTNLVKYSAPAIGDRAKSVNDDKVKAIYFRETPTALFTENIQTVDRKSGYSYLQYKPEMADLFNISSQGKSAVDVMQEFINNYLYCVESISITSVPIYQLQPNTRIMVYDEKSKINGEYLVNRISIPLAFNGTMSISATKSAETIY